MAELIPVLIVEDERIILEDILNMIDWEAEGFRVVATAGNGMLGCRAYREHHPELIIADIQMPVMDGLAMLRTIREEDESVSFLILSSYSEFEYAKEAVRLGTDSYVLKTELSGDLLHNTLSPIREKILSRRSMRQLTNRHRLFALFSAAVEPNGEPVPTADAISAAFRAYWELPGARHERRKQLMWVVRECYGVLGISERGEVLEAEDADGVEGWLLREYEKLCRYYNSVVVQKYSPVIINADAYIREHYASPQLKISTVAEYVGLSSSRLSVLFKQELGVTVNDHITQIRIQAAKELLSSGRYKVYEVSELVGYKTGQYFSQVFAQYTGCSPTDYLRRDGK